MTKEERKEREEAIETLKDMIDYHWGISDDEVSRAIPALELAIECIEETIKEERTMIIHQEEMIITKNVLYVPKRSLYKISRPVIPEDDNHLYEHDFLYIYTSMDTTIEDKNVLDSYNIRDFIINADISKMEDDDLVKISFVSDEPALLWIYYMYICDIVFEYEWCNGHSHGILTDTADDKELELLDYYDDWTVDQPIFTIV